MLASKCSRTWLSAHGIFQESPFRVWNYADRKWRVELYFLELALLAELQFSLSLSDLCCFLENMAELSSDLRQLPCE
ncbi:hypothetical protein T4B_1315 [Trichinella pseudospiralis]|uniref:Uncharacterized protein n=1 Tax=Trichinella pseudospiralis TaxID=6337 RepID=A0A0V1EUJ4_TRIPS|nr:hypothetical protein T4A_9967 [Trichinella pseudospiralis]KRZ33419.1 hypothetical protein T4B_1315 [Trichinella pseudospiralis]KRZ41194.1 hypothetical protein T4C_8149 [Trichinella pseudospiralis]